MSLTLQHDVTSIPAALNFLVGFFTPISSLKSVSHHYDIVSDTTWYISHVDAGSSNTTSVDPPLDPQLVSVAWGVCECNQTMQVHLLLPCCGICCISHVSIWQKTAVQGVSSMQ